MMFNQIGNFHYRRSLLDMEYKKLLPKCDVIKRMVSPNIIEATRQVNTLFKSNCHSLRLLKERD